MTHKRTKQELARHEAAHFVVAWATHRPDPYVDISSAVQDAGDGTEGRTFGSIYNELIPFENILVSLAGPAADYWEQDISHLIKGNKHHIDSTLEDIAEKLPLLDGTDWDGCLHGMKRYGINVLDSKTLNDALAIFIDAVRSLLNMCKTEWQETTDFLIEHERIGWNGEHFDYGEEAATFFARWGDDWGDPPEAVESCVEKWRAAIQASPLISCSTP